MIASISIVAFIVLFIVYSIFFFKYIESNYSLKISYNLFFLYLITFASLIAYMGNALAYPFQSLFLFAFIFITITIFFDMPLINRVFFTSGYCFITIVSHGILISSYSFLQQITFQSMRNDQIISALSEAGSYILSIVLLSLSAFFFKRRRVMQSLDNHSLTAVTTVLVVFLTFLNVATIVLYIQSDFKLFPIFYLSLSLLFLISTIAIIAYYSDVDIVDQTLEKNKMLEKQLILQMNHYKKNVEYITALRKIKHDYFNLLTSLEYVSENYEKEELLKYVKELHQNAVKIDNAFNQYSNNPLIDAVISDAMGICEKSNIKLESLVNIPESLKLSDDELCFIFASILNKSIAVSDECAAQEKLIRLTSNIKNNWVVITSTCNFDDNKNARLRLDNSSNYPDKGIHTLYIVEEIAKKYSGFIEINEDSDNHFYQIQLFLPKNTQTS